MTKLLFLLAAIALAADHSGHAGSSVRPAELMPGFGAVNHRITTSNAEAQKYFNQGLSLIYGFNHEEAIRSFRKAAELDPNCAMAYWGIGFSLGSNYNDPEPEAERLEKAYAATQQALRLGAGATPRERAYIDALSKRYSASKDADKSKLAVAYKGAMAALAAKYPSDLDAATLYAESYMNLRPWNLYSVDGTPAEGTGAIVATLEKVLRKNPNHLGANHYYIHAIEASKTPGKGLAAARRLDSLAPKSGHLVHMPAHIYHRTGDYKASARANEKGAEADREYIKKTGATGMYPAMYYAHNIHFLAIDRAMQNDYAGAKKAADELIAMLGGKAVQMPMIEFFMPTQALIAVKLRQWDDVLALPEPHKDLKTTHGLWHFARGMAYAAKNDTAAANSESERLAAALDAAPADASFGLNKSKSVLKLASLVLAAKLRPADAERSLREALLIEDGLSYEEPPIWYMPVRESLGALLLSQGKAKQAEEIFRADLKDNPNSGRSLFGLSKALEAQGKKAEARKLHGAHTGLAIDQL